MTIRVLALCASIAVTAGVLSPSAARAQSKPPETADAISINESAAWPRYLHDALGLPEWLDLAVEHRTRYEALSHAFRPGEPDHQSQYPQRTRVRLGLDGPGPFRFLAEVQDARTHGDEPGDFTANQTNETDLLQLFVAATGSNLLDSGLRGDLQVGRLTMDFGSRRLIARNAHRNTTNTFDGVHVQIGSPDLAWRVRSFYTQPVQLLADEWDDKSSSKQRFWGLAFEDKRIAWLNLETYYFGLRDLTGDRKYSTFGTRLRRPAKKQQLDYELEGIGQFGDRGPKDQSAFDGHAEAGYSFALPWSPRLSAQFEYASGTSDPSGDTSHTFDPLFGARRFDLIPTGIYGPFRRANIVSTGVGLGFAPLPTVRAQLRMRYWQLAKKRDAFVGTGLRDPSGASGRNLGTDLELRVLWNPSPWLQLDMGIDYWVKGSYFDSVPNAPTTDDSYYAYAAAQVRF